MPVKFYYPVASSQISPDSAGVCSSILCKQGFIILYDLYTMYTIAIVTITCDMFCLNEVACVKMQTKTVI